jgi:NADH:ubiquinone oxidoreductase subunit 6 (subunit J)
MLFKIIVFIAAAIPIVLFVRTMLFRRPTRVSASFQEFKKQANLAVTIFLVLIACVVAAGMGKLAWTWWSSF